MILKFKSLKDRYIFSDFIHRKKDYIFLDLEFNCFTDDESFHEITSIGAVKCDSNFNNVNCFHAYITPISYEKNQNKNIDNSFCKLKDNKKVPTKGSSFTKAIEDLCNWIGETESDIFVWGTQDTPVLLANFEATNTLNKYSFLLNRIKNIQPEVSGSIKVLGNPINYSISLENMKKLFFFKKEVAHNGLLDSIDLMNVFKKYKENSEINQDILYELSYVYRNVDTDFQFCTLKKNQKNKKNIMNVKSRALVKKPNNLILENIFNTLNTCNFKFDNECPRFSIDSENNRVLFDKLELKNQQITFNTTKQSSTFEILEDFIKLKLNNEEYCEELNIHTKNLDIETQNKLKNEILFSSYIYHDLILHEYTERDIELLNHFLQNIDINFSCNIEEISIKDRKLYIKRKKDDNGNLLSKFSCNFYIKDEINQYVLSICHKSINKKDAVQIHFNIPKNERSNKIVQELISTNPENKFIKPKLTNVNSLTKKLIIDLAQNKALRTRRKSQLFANDNKLSFLNGRNMEYINLDNASFFIANKERPFIIFKNLQSNKTFEIRVLKNKKTIRTIQNLFQLYSQDKPKITKILDMNNDTFDKINILKKLPGFSESNKLTYTINNSYIKIRKNITNELQTEVYNLNDFKTSINVNKHYNISINFTSKKDKKKILATCINSKKLSNKDINIFIEYISNKYQINNTIKIGYFSENLFEILLKSHKQGLVEYNNQYTDLTIEEESFKLRKKNTHNHFIDIANLSIEMLISNHFMFIKLFDEKNIYYYSLENNEQNEVAINSLFKLIKKHKANSWIKVLEINKHIRNSIWRVIENSDKNNSTLLTLDSNYIQVAQKKYFYKQTPLFVKKINSEEMLLQFGATDSTLYNVSINEKNKVFIDDLINNSLFYEDN